MNYLDELKEFVKLHITSQNVDHPTFTRVLAQIQHEDQWSSNWVALGETYLEQKNFENAMACFNFGRFPFVKDQVSKRSHQLCVSTFEKHLADKANATRQYIEFQNQQVPVYLSGLGPNRPLLLVIGGIVSIKEQWSNFLAMGPKMGFAVAVTECPGVGENPLIYKPSSHGFLGALLDQLATTANVMDTYMVAMSFGGHLALQQARVDMRIRGIITPGAPLHEFFTDRDWWDRVPAVTKRTLAHLMDCPVEKAMDLLPAFALSASELNALRIPIHYIASLQDEIIPQSETAFLKTHASCLNLIAFDDVHGSPNNFGTIKKFVLSNLLAMSGKAPLLRILLSLALKTARIQRKFINQ